MKKQKSRKANIVFAFVIAAFSLILSLLPTGFENPNLLRHSARVKARIVEADNTPLEQHGIVTVGSQKLKIEILQGSFRGEVTDARNILLGQKRIDKIFAAGDKVLAVIKTNAAGTRIESARADDYYRINLIYILFGLFAVFLISFAGWTGFKALLSFVFTALSFWKILIPLFLKGFPPISLALITVSVTTTVIVLLITGFTRKGLTALSGSVVGLTITTLLALLFGYFFRIPGTVPEYSESLLYAGFEHLRLSDIFLACIFISAAGAVMDVAMDIAAAQHELMEKKPDLTSGELIRSGFHIAYPVIGTMTTTLLFAYSGSFMFLFMYFMTKGTPVISILNTSYIAAEVLHTLVGSFGLVLVAPATAIIGGYVYKKNFGSGQ